MSQYSKTGHAKSNILVQNRLANLLALHQRIDESLHRSTRRLGPLKEPAIASDDIVHPVLGSIVEFFEVSV